MALRRHSPQSQRFADRRRREDEASRLRDEVPDLLSLRLDIEERTDVGANAYTRRVVVGQAPALFLVPCSDPRCDGEHDLTAAVMRALRNREALFHGEDPCPGTVGANACSRVIRYVARAEYRR